MIFQYIHHTLLTNFNLDHCTHKASHRSLLFTSKYQFHHQFISDHNEKTGDCHTFLNIEMLTSAPLKTSPCLLLLLMFFSIQPGFLGFYYKNTQNRDNCAAIVKMLFLTTWIRVIYDSFKIFTFHDHSTRTLIRICRVLWIWIFDELICFFIFSTKLWEPLRGKDALCRQVFINHHKVETPTHIAGSLRKISEARAHESIHYKRAMPHFSRGICKVAIDKAKFWIKNIKFHLFTFSLKISLQLFMH